MRPRLRMSSVPTARSDRSERPLGDIGGYASRTSFLAEKAQKADDPDGDEEIRSHDTARQRLQRKRLYPRLAEPEPLPEASLLAEED